MISSGLEFGFRHGGPLTADPSPPPGPDDVVEYVPSALVGGRLPHVPVRTEDGRTSVLHLVDTDPATLTLLTSSPDAWSSRLIDAVPDGLRVVVVDLTSTCPDPDQAARILGTMRGGAVAVRCDGHIVWCTEYAALDAADAFVSFLTARWAPLFGHAPSHRDREGTHDHQRP